MTGSLSKSIFGAAFLFHIFLVPGIALTQQQPTAPQPPIARPAYQHDTGPVVAIDEAHSNTHTYGNQLQGFVRLLQRDGYRVRRFTEPISRRSLEGIDVLVVAQPGGWGYPDDSLNDRETADLVEWVRAGGSLLLLVDHMPAPSNAAKVATALGVSKWHDGFAMVQLSDSVIGRIIFHRSSSFPEEAPNILLTGPAGSANVPSYQGADAVLADHPIAEGRDPAERVRRVMTFVGSAFELPAGAETVLIMPRQAVSLMPDSADGRILSRPDVPRVPVGGWQQGAVMNVGKGRVAFFGETALFSGQWPVHPAASENYKLILNVMHWLTRLL